MSKLILVVEDDADIRDLIIAVLSEAGYTPTGAANGKRALEILTNLTFDLITLDINMPEMDGKQLLKELGKVAPATSVIVLTAQEQSLKPHPQVKAIIAKPFDVEQLLVLLEKYTT